jgi:hypothetical protein
MRIYTKADQNQFGQPLCFMTAGAGANNHSPIFLWQPKYFL